ncbi:hypothetical protein IM538_06450 [Cytobacillus suaedae]|nr:hypothetical protein IM538_06450 [Cytobacillus suaedae]
MFKRNTPMNNPYMGNQSLPMNQFGPTNFPQQGFTPEVPNAQFQAPMTLPYGPYEVGPSSPVGPVYGGGLTPSTPTDYDFDDDMDFGTPSPLMGQQQLPMGYNPNMSTSPGMGFTPGMNPTQGMDFTPGMNPTQGMGFTPGMNPTPGMGFTPGMNPTPGMGFTPGMNPNPGIGFTPGMNPTPGMGFTPGMNPTPGMGFTPGMNPHAGMGHGYGCGCGR